MARLNNAKAAEAIANREVFDTYRNSLRGRKTFDGWGDLPESKRTNPAQVSYWVYSYDTPIAWVRMFNGGVTMPAVDLSPTTRTHQELTARALGVEARRRCHCGQPGSGTGDYPDVCDQWPLCEKSTTNRKA